MNLTKIRSAMAAAVLVWFVLAMGLFGLAGSCWAQTVDTLWTEGFEGDWSSRWADDHGTWEVGTPTSGPNATHSGTNLLATVLAGDYTDGVDTRFYQLQSWVVPAADQHPRLRFWHWWNISSWDAGYVEIQVAGGAWQTLESYDRHSSNRWTRGFVDLTPFAGQTVKLSFRFTSSPGGVGPGWYLDDVTVETGDRALTWPEGWESGIGSWYADRGMWEVGVPTSGPNSAHTRNSVAATILDDNYYDGLDSRLISPTFVVPAADQYPRLRFWHWWNISSWDAGYVQIQVAGGAWQTLESYDRHSSNRWTRGFVDLTPFAGQTVKLGFYFASSPGGVGPGWYIDDVMIETGQRPLDPLTTWDGTDGIGAWYADRGTWEVGVPTSGPASAYSGTNVAATILDGNYDDGLDCRLISPPFFLRPPTGSTPTLRFRNWYRFSSWDAGCVQVRIREGAWQTIGTTFTGSSGVSADWSSYPYYDLSAYSDSLVQLCFYFSSSPGGVDVGWYIDDVELDYTVAWTPTLLSLVSADVTADGVKLAWFAGGSETAVATVYRSSVGGEWTRIGEVMVDGTGYLRYTDPIDASATRVGYRLGIVEAGIESFYGETWVDLPAREGDGSFAFALGGVRPNPSQGGRLSVAFTLPTTAPAKLELVDVSGRRVVEREVGSLGAGPHTLDLGQGQHLAPGIYLVRLTQGTNTRTSRVAVLR